MHGLCPNKSKAHNRCRKKKLSDWSVDLRSVFITNPDASLEDAIDIAFYKAANLQIAGGVHVH